MTSAVLVGLTVCSTSPALADESTTTVDVLKVVDGDYVVETVTAPTATAEATADDLEARPEVVAASPSVTYALQGQPDPYWDPTDPGGASSVKNVWPVTRGAGQIVAVLDSTSTLDNSDLAGAGVPGVDIAGGTGDPWHGTGVSGVIAARADNGIGSAGMAPEAAIMPVRVCNDGGCTSADVAKGILWAADHGADVINMSLAGAGYSDVTAVAIQYALDKNISVVASAGNDGLNGNPVMYPAANSGVIAVSSTTPAGAPSDWAEHGWQVDLSTVGDSVLLTLPGNGFGNGSGTSFSGPAVAGAVALLRASHPGIGVQSVQAALQAGAESTSWDRSYGAGRLDVPSAFAAADRPGTAPVVTPASQQVAVSWPASPGATQYTVRVDGVIRATVSGTSTTISGLTDGNQVAVDVEPSNGSRSAPALATVGPPLASTPVLYSATLSGSSTSAAVTLSASTPGAVAPKYALIRDGMSLGTLTLAMTGAPQSFSISIGAMPTVQTRWQVRGVDTLGRMTADSNSVVAGSGTPAPPAGVTGLAASLSGNDVLLTWDDLGDPMTYRVSADGSTVATPHTAGAVVPAPAVGGTRTYQVVAVDPYGQNGPAATVTYTRIELPGAPVIGTADASDRSVTVRWAAPASDGGSPLTGYTVRTFRGATAVGTTSAAASATSAVVTGLTNGTAYTFTVAATNAGGTGSPSAATAAVTPRTTPAAPVIGTASSRNASATVRWSPPADGGSPITGYTVQAYSGATAVSTTAVPAGATSVIVPGLANGTAYTFTVAATNALGTGPASASSAAVTPRQVSAAAAATDLAFVHRLGAGGMNLWRVPVSQLDGGYGVPQLVKTLDFGGFSYDRSRTLAGNVGDVTGSDDGTPDSIIWHAQPNGGVLLWGVGGGADTTPRLWADLRTGGWSWADSVPMIGDVTGDGFDDLVVRHAFGPTLTNIWVFPSDGTKLLGTPQLWGTTYGLAQRSLLADVDGDGRDDVVVARAVSGSSGLVYDVLGANASGTAFDGFRSTVFTGSPAAGWSEGASRTLAADVTGDGRPDLVTVHAQAGNPGLLVWVHRNCSTTTGAACFEAPTIWQDLRTGGWSYAGSRQYVADTDGDGTDDLITAHSQVGNPGILLWRARSTSTALSAPEIIADLRSGGWSYAASRGTVG